jgi:hypothetical protein
MFKRESFCSNAKAALAEGELELRFFSSLFSLTVSNEEGIAFRLHLDRAEVDRFCAFVAEH